MHDESEKPHALVCTEVWGGNRKVSRTVKLPSLMAWVASTPIHDGEGGGDLHYMSVCDYDLDEFTFEVQQCVPRIPRWEF
jgi:hypothetical protein